MAEAKEKKEKEEKKEKKKEEKFEVTILDRTFIEVFPRLRERHAQVLVTYTYADFPPRTVTIDLFDLFKEKQVIAEVQIKERKGPFWEKYKEAEAKALREDVKALILVKPEVITI